MKQNLGSSHGPDAHPQSARSGGEAPAVDVGSVSIGSITPSGSSIAAASITVAALFTGDWVESLVFSGSLLHPVEPPVRGRAGGVMAMGWLAWVAQPRRGR